MTLQGWNECSAATKAQVQGLVQAISGLLDDLEGVYLHGSLAMGCFNSRHSDLDVLIVTSGRLTGRTKLSLGALPLKLSRSPHPVELSVVCMRDLTPWQHPAPFEFHYSETWREATRQQVESGTWELWNDQPRDPDLAAHLIVTRQRGVCLFGTPAQEVLPVVPQADVLASILVDVHASLGDIEASLEYAILNACRTLAFVQGGFVYFKQEGGAWALGAVPRLLKPVVKWVLDAYAADASGPSVDPTALQAFAVWMQQQLPPAEL